MCLDSFFRCGMCDNKCSGWMSSRWLDNVFGIWGQKYWKVTENRVGSQSAVLFYVNPNAITYLRQAGVYVLLPLSLDFLTKGLFTSDIMTRYSWKYLLIALLVLLKVLWSHNTRVLLYYSSISTECGHYWWYKFKLCFSCHDMSKCLLWNMFITKCTLLLYFIMTLTATMIIFIITSSSDHQSFLINWSIFWYL